MSVRGDKSPDRIQPVFTRDHLVTLLCGSIIINFALLMTLMADSKVDHSVSAIVALTGVAFMARAVFAARRSRHKDLTHANT